MRPMPIITAALVVVALFFLIFQRDALLAFAQSDGGAQTDEAPEGSDDTGDLVRVVAMASTAQSVDNAVILRGRTEAARQVEVRAETTGQVISEPLRKGVQVEAGQLMCELDPGTRQASLQEALGRLQEAKARLPEAQARVPEAEARIPEAQARIPEAQARMAEAISKQAEAEARVMEARSRVAEAQGRVDEAAARVEAARIEQNAAQQLAQSGFASDTRVANAEAALESALAGVSSAQASLEGAQAGISSAEANVEGARAAVQSAQAGIESARAGVEGARAGIESVAAGVEGALAGIESAQAAVASAERELERLTITAPFAGLLETDTAELGSLLQPGSLCATVIQLDPIKLVGFVPEISVGKVAVGAAAGAELASGAQVQGKVTFLSRSADELTRTFRVEIEVPNPDGAIRDGQTADILVASDGESAHLLPQSSLTLNDDGALGVRTVAEGDIVRFMPISILRDTRDGVWATGLPPEINVITVGQEFVIDGVKVAPTYQEAEG